MEIASIASRLFGSSSAATIFSLGQSVSGTSVQQSAQAIITAQKREISRIRGYKLDLTPTDNRKLTELADKIKVIEAKAVAGTVRADELDDRLEFFEEADRIVGKPIVDVEADQKLAEFNALREALLEPKLDSATAKHVAFLERYRDSLEDQISENPDRRTPQIRIRSAIAQIKQLKPPRLTTELSIAERKTYDDIVELINDHAGIKIELTARESDKVIALENSIRNFRALLGPDISQQPTPQAVARAYISLARR